MSPIAVQSIVALWLFATGGAIGSFLNVVVYRLPRGMSLIQPGSHCPACKHPIRWYDNLPILGWLILRGRCRDCQASISFRYPFVEAIAAALFLGLGMVEGFSGGANLPARPLPVENGVVFPPWNMDQVTGIVAYHLLLLSTLLAAALIECDGHRVPLRVALPALAIGGLAPLAWPHLHPVPACLGLTGWVAGLADGAAGSAVAGLWGLAAEYLLHRQRGFGRPAVWACAGLFLGWQAAVVLAVVCTAASLVPVALQRVSPDGRRATSLTWLTLAALVWILAWAPLVRHWPLLG